MVMTSLGIFHYGLRVMAGALWSALSVAAVAADLSFRTYRLGPLEDGGSRAWPLTADAMAVAADGTCLVVSATAGGAGEAVFYRDGRWSGMCEPVLPRWAGGENLPAAAAISGEHVWVAAAVGGRSVRPDPGGGDSTHLPGEGVVWTGVCRFDRAGKPAAFPGGRTPAGSMLVLHEFFDTGEPDDPSGGGLPPVEAKRPTAVTGLWVHDGEVFISDAAAGKIRVHDASTLQEKRVFRAQAPGPLCVLAGKLYVVEGRSIVSTFTLNGRRTGQVLDEGSDLIPGAIAPTAEGRLMISDLGPAQQVHFYNMSGVPTRVRTLGDEFGMDGPPRLGAAGPRRLGRITGVGADATGGLYVAMSPPPGGCLIRAFEPDRKSLRWEWLGPALVGGADFDPLSHQADIITATSRYDLEVTRFPDLSWQWAAHTLNPFRHPQDPRLELRSLPRFSTTMITLDRQRFQVRERHGASVHLEWYRHTGSTAAPVAILSVGPSPTPDPAAGRLPASPSAAGAWFWRDLNGDSLMTGEETIAAPDVIASCRASHVDAAGTVWLGGADGRLHQLPCLGMDADLLPRYDVAGLVSRPAPVEIRNTRVFAHDAVAGAFYAADGESGASSQATDDAAPGVGHRLFRFDGWARGQEAGPPRWGATVAAGPGGGGMAGVSAAGDLVFALTSPEEAVHVLDARSGALVGVIPGDGRSRLQGASAVPSIRARRDRDGSYLILVQTADPTRCLIHHLIHPAAAADPAPR